MTGPELRALRERKGYSLTQLAAATGWSVSRICRYQSGEAAIPEKFAKAALALKSRRT